MTIADDLAQAIGDISIQPNNYMLKAQAALAVLMRYGLTPSKLESLRAGTASIVEWRGIATAPKDGTIVIVPGGLAYFRVGPDAWYTITAEQWPGRPIEWTVHWWMPLPPPPPQQQERFK